MIKSEHVQFILQTYTFATVHSVNYIQDNICKKICCWIGLMLHFCPTWSRLFSNK